MKELREVRETLSLMTWAGIGAFFGLCALFISQPSIWVRIPVGAFLVFDGVVQLFALDAVDKLTRAISDAGSGPSGDR